MDLNTLKSQLDTTESQLGQYTANLPSEIETQIQNAYTPALENSLNTTKDMMGDYLGRYFDTTTMGPGMQGSTAIDLSPTQKLGVMGRELGTMSGELQATQRFSDYLGGQMQDMYSKALQAAQMGQQNLADQYQRQFQLYQLAWQEAQAEKDRANALAAARAAAPVYNYSDTGGRNGNGNGNGNEDDDVIDTGPGLGQKIDKVYASDWLGADYSKAPTSAGSGILKGVQLMNPLTAIKTTAGFAGNLAGNWQNQNMSFLDKLLNRR